TIVDLVKDDVLGPLKSSILAPNSVNPRDNLAEVIGAANCPVAYLIFIGGPVLFAPRLKRLLSSELESRALDAVIGAEGGRKNESNEECRPAAGLEIGVEDIGLIGSEIGTKED